MPTICTHCSNGCKTTLSVRNHEIMRVEQSRPFRHQQRFSVREGALRFRFHASIRNASSSRCCGAARSLYPVSWEEAAQAAATKLKQVSMTSGKDAIGFIGSNRTSNEENYLFQRLARQTFGTNNVDHHRTADYTGLVTALGERAGEHMLTMAAAVRCEGRSGDRQRSYAIRIRWSRGRFAPGSDISRSQTLHHQFAAKSSWSARPRSS